MIFSQNFNQIILPCHQFFRRSFGQVLSRGLELSLPILDTNANTANTVNTYQLGLKFFRGPNFKTRDYENKLSSRRDNSPSPRTPSLAW